MNEKKCKSCGAVKPVDLFPKHRRCQDGVYTRCKECTNRDNRISWLKHADERRERSRRWQKDNADKRRDYANRKYRELKDIVISGYGGKCAFCGFSDTRALCIDHVNGNGIQERKTSCAISTIRKIIKEGFPKQYQILCSNCNLIKAIDKAEIPVSSIYRR